VTFAVWFEQTYASWVKNVTVGHSSNYNVFFNDSLNCELRHSRLDELNHAGSNGAGLLMNTVSGCLIEDNIIRERVFVPTDKQQNLELHPKTLPGAPGVGNGPVNG